MKPILQFLTRESLWPVFVLLVGALVILPGLSESGFWEPQEIRIADKAIKRAGLGEDQNPDKDKAKANDKAKNKSAKKKKHKKKTVDDVRPPLTEWSVAQSMKRVGTGGFGARLPLALLGLIALLATFFLGQRLSSPRAGLLSAFILLSFPLFLWQSRQLISHMGAIAGSALLMLGLVGLAWPVGVRPRPRAGGAPVERGHALALFGQREHRLWMYAIDLALVAVGAVLCYYASAALLGLVVPFGAMGLACLGAFAGKLHIERDARCSVERHTRPAYDRQHLAAVGLAVLCLTALAAIVVSFTAEPDSLAVSITVLPALLGVVLVAVGMSQSGVRHRLSFDARWRQWHLLIAGGITLAIALGVLFAVLAAIFDLRDPIPGERALFGHSIVPTDDPLEILGGKWNLRDNGTATFDVLFEQLAFGLFPWVALAPIAVALVAMGLQRGRRTWAGYVLFAWVALAWLVCAVMARKVGSVVFPALAPVAVAIGMWLDGLLDARDQADATTESERDARNQFGMPLRQPLVAMFAALTTIAIAANILAFPGKFLAVHAAGETIAYPKGAGTEVLKIKLSQWVAVLGVGLGLALAVGLFLWASHRRVGRHSRLMFAVRRYGIHAAVGIGLLYALFLAHVWQPTLSEQFSTKNIFAKYHELRKDGDLLGLMGQYGSAPKYYVEGDYEKLAGRHQLIQFLKREERVFALVPSSDQCSLHRSIKASGPRSGKSSGKSRSGAKAGAPDAEKKPYYVLSQNAKTLLLSNELNTAAGETDVNALAGAIRKQKPTDIGTPLNINYDNRIEVVGATMPVKVGRGDTFRMTLVYKVKKSISGKWKVFVHFDGGASRFQGDHEPIGGLCATNFWQPGDYIVDTFEVEAGNITYARTAYNIHIGFFQGSHGNWRNMKVVSAEGERGKLTVDDNNRVKIGRIIVK